MRTISSGSTETRHVALQNGARCVLTQVQHFVDATPQAIRGHVLPETEVVEELILTRRQLSTHSCGFPRET